MKKILILLLALVLVASAHAALTDQITACLSGDIGYDDYYGSYDATGGVTSNITSDAKIGSGAIRLNGTSGSYVNWGNVPFNTTGGSSAWTVSAWVKFNSKYGSDGVKQPLIGRFVSTPTATPFGLDLIDSAGSDYMYALVGDGTNHEQLDTGTGLNLGLNEWFYIAWVFDGNNVGTHELFINGTSVKTWTDSGNVVDQSDSYDLWIGARTGGVGWGYANITVDTITMWGRNLSDAEITEDYNSHNGLDCSKSSTGTNYDFGCFGDSITAGSQIGGTTETYCHNFGEIENYTDYNWGTAGDTSTDLRNRITDVIGKNYNFTIVLVGANDLNPGNPDKTNVSEYYDNLMNITQDLLDDNQQVVLSTLSPQNESTYLTPEDNQTLIIERNNVVRYVSWIKNLCYADIFEDVFNSTYIADLMHDNVHVAPDGHDLMNTTYYNAFLACAPFDCSANESACYNPETASISLSADVISGGNYSDNPFQLNITASTVNITTDAWNCTMNLNNTLNQSMMDVALNATLQTFNLTYGTDEIAYDINITCSKMQDDQLLSGQVLLNDVFIDSVAPGVGINPQFTNLSFIWRYVDPLSFNMTCSDTNLIACNTSIFFLNPVDYSINTTKNSTYASSLSGPSYTIPYQDLTEVDVETYNWTNGMYLIRGEAWDLNNVHHTVVDYFFNVTDGFRFFAVDVFTNATVSNFTIGILNGSTLLQAKSTTSGRIGFNITVGNLSTNFSSASYADNQTSILEFTVNGSFTYSVFASNSLYLFVYDEQTNTLITDVNPTIKITNFNVSSVEVNTAAGTVFQSGFSPGIYELRYWADGYNIRSYYTTITSSSTQQIDLYLLNTSHGTYTSFINQDETGNKYEGAYLKSLRHFTSCNCFKVVAMDLTNFNGVAIQDLEHYIGKYKFIVDYNNATVYASTAPEGYILSESAYTLTWTLLGDTTESFFGTSGLYHNVSWDNSTKFFHYTLNDPSNLVDQFCLYVDEMDLQSSAGYFRRCSSCLNSSSGVISCNMTDYIASGHELIARPWIHTSTEFSEYWADPVSVFTDFSAVASMGKLGVFLGVIVVTTMFFGGLVIAGLPGAIIFMDLALIGMVIVEMIVISLPILIGLVTISLIVLILVGDL